MQSVLNCIPEIAMTRILVTYTHAICIFLCTHAAILYWYYIPIKFPIHLNMQLYSKCVTCTSQHWQYTECTQSYKHNNRAWHIATHFACSSSEQKNSNTLFNTMMSARWRSSDWLRTSSLTTFTREARPYFEMSRVWRSLKYGLISIPIICWAWEYACAYRNGSV